MKRTGFVFFLLWLLAGMIRAQDGYVEVKSTCFNPSDPAFKDIYGSGFMYGGEVGIELWLGLDIWLEGMYFSKEGETSLTKEKTAISLLPVSGGLRADFDLGPVTLYLAGGLTHFLYSESSPIGDAEAGEWGWLIRGGTVVDFSSRLFLDVQVSCSSAAIRKEDIVADLGGFSFGAGLGFRF